MRIRGCVRYLGPHGSPESLEEYGRLVAELAASPAVPPASFALPGGLTVVELAAAYLDFAETYYRKGGVPTRTVDDVRRAIDLTTERYGRTPVAEFGPLALIAIQNQLVEKGVSRGYVNSLVRKIRHMFKWGVSRQLVPPGFYQALATVEGLKKGRTSARETQPVKPVEDAVVEATLPHLPSVVADMVRFQRLTGCRPGEVCHLRPMDLDRAREVWAFKPSSHKTEHHGHQRIIFVGPKAQAIVLSYLLRPADAYCFSPVESVERRNVALRARRKTKVQPSQVSRKKARPKRIPKEQYTRHSYRQAVVRQSRKRTRRLPKRLHRREPIRSCSTTGTPTSCGTPPALKFDASTGWRQPRWFSGTLRPM